MWWKVILKGFNYAMKLGSKAVKVGGKAIKNPWVLGASSALLVTDATREVIAKHRMLKVTSDEFADVRMRYLRKLVASPYDESAHLEYLRSMGYDALAEENFQDESNLNERADLGFNHGRDVVYEIPSENDGYRINVNALRQIGENFISAANGAGLMMRGRVNAPGANAHIDLNQSLVKAGVKLGETLASSSQTSSQCLIESLLAGLALALSGRPTDDVVIRLIAVALDSDPTCSVTRDLVAMSQRLLDTLSTRRLF